MSWALGRSLLALPTLLQVALAVSQKNGRVKLDLVSPRRVQIPGKACDCTEKSTIKDSGRHLRI